MVELMVHIILDTCLVCLSMFHWAIKAHFIMMRAVEDQALVRFHAGSWRTYLMDAYQSMMERFSLYVFIHELAFYTFVFKFIYYTFWCSVLLYVSYVLRAFYTLITNARIALDDGKSNDFPALPMIEDGGANAGRAPVVH